MGDCETHVRELKFESSPCRASNVLAPLVLESQQHSISQSSRSRSLPGIFALAGSTPVRQAITPSKVTKHRYETSLGQLTKKFITLLKEAPEGVSGRSARKTTTCWLVANF